MLPLAKQPNAEVAVTSSRSSCTATDATVSCPRAMAPRAFARVPSGARDERRRNRRCSSSSWSATVPCCRPPCASAEAEEADEHAEAEECDE
eukprot:4430717-Heterocapsa_arctica.AAC.1